MPLSLTQPRRRDAAGRLGRIILRLVLVGVALLLVLAVAAVALVVWLLVNADAALAWLRDLLQQVQPIISFFGQLAPSDG